MPLMTLARIGARAAGRSEVIPGRTGVACVVHGLRERGASADQVIGGNYDLHAAESGVSKLDVDVGIGESPGQLAEGAGPILDADHEHLALIGDPDPGALKRLPAQSHGVVVEQQVDDTSALTSEPRKAPDTDADFPSDLRQPGKLSRPVFENHCQVRRHRIFDLATWRPAPAKLIITQAVQHGDCTRRPGALMTVLFYREARTSGART